jgi:CDP-glucose 4,6-dehydratase
VADRSYWEGRRVLLTGHTGFKGAWLALWLHSLGAEVHGFSTAPPSEPSLFSLAGVGELIASSEIGDVRDAAAVRRAAAGAEVVLHLAAQAIVRRSLADPLETWEVNVVGTVNVLEAARGAERVLVVTSDKCYRDVESGRPMHEDDPLGGKDPYSASKAAQELVARSYRDTLGVPVATARAGNVIGGGDWAADRLVPDLFRAALAGEPLAIRSPAAVRPWQHVLNPLSGYLRLVESGETGAFNFGPDAGDEQPVEWLVERLVERWREPLEVRVVQDADASKESSVLRLDSSRARSALGWAPGWDLAAGLDATVEWYSSYRRGEDLQTLSVEQIERFAQGT